MVFREFKTIENTGERECACEENINGNLRAALCELFMSNKPSGGKMSENLRNVAVARNAASRPDGI